MYKGIAPYTPVNNIRIITATSLFDGHDASINIFKRILQMTGVEVIHLGHNRSVTEIVNTALQEDAHGIAVSSYQGGHIEFFKYMVDLLKDANAINIKIFCGGGGVIVPEEIKELIKYGVTKIYSPDDGSKMGLQGIVNHMVKTMDEETKPINISNIDNLNVNNKILTAKFITVIEEIESKKQNNKSILKKLKSKISNKIIPVIGITGTGGAGKSSLTDELILRLLFDNKNINIAIISADPSRRRSGGALLGDRIRMNAIANDQIYMRSVATRQSNSEIPKCMTEFIKVLKASEYDLIIVETAGIGQGDSNIVNMVDLSIYVMTSDFGATSQLEKIDMLDFADLVVINKYDKKGSEDAVRDIKKQVSNNCEAFNKIRNEIPVFGTIASKFNDDGITSLYHCMLNIIEKKTKISLKSSLPIKDIHTSSSKTIIIPPERTRYLSEISNTVRKYHKYSIKESQNIRKWWHLLESSMIINNKNDNKKQILIDSLKKQAKKQWDSLDEKTKKTLKEWKEIRKKYLSDNYSYFVRNKKIEVPLYTKSLSNNKIPKIALPKYVDPGEIYSWLRSENIPGFFPYTSGVFPIKRTDEDPTRMFAGEGDPKKTNHRFKLLSKNNKAKRLSTAFDSATLYGQDPDKRPDIYGKIGNSGVSICTLNDIKILYSGFDLCSPTTSVSMTINGPAPIILAMFFNTAIDQKVEKFILENKKNPSNEEYKKIKSETLKNIRGTVQADILKEDQGQNTCIFSTDFSLKMMGDVQEYFIDKKINNFYSVSISGYHIAEAGANPISQLAFTLANGFTYIEYYLSRKMNIDDFAPNFSFFFSNGMDPEYTVIGRVARRIWAIALKEKYNASTRSQILKYHIQTSGRSLHSQEIQFNDIRTTLQALCAIYDNCNSLHTNSFDEAITTPSKESVRRALAIQLIINREWGLAKNENIYQGSFIIEELTNLVEEAVLLEFNNISSRGGVLSAMETGYQRSKIQEESIHYETLKHNGNLPIIGVNTFKNKNDTDNNIKIELARATKEEKNSQIKRLAAFKELNKNNSKQALHSLQKKALQNENIFAELMKTVRYCSLGEITLALHKVGGKYRRNM